MAPAVPQNEETNNHKGGYINFQVKCQL